MGEANQAVFEHLFPRFDKRAAQRGPRTLADHRAELIQVAVAAVQSLDRQQRGLRSQED
ncbi:hypothetical protein [Deinococcus aerophilus]|uniref:Uncharacterized protein n=1 Tax=Deinococcus aerophilus TaxID=522488 RepID=A0ABQ2GJ44_9DEIO|nr:hypothetical protein [Deinococcus aerophilus]GGL98003.1 hypothetical protein GCM10010841_02960 [Deinococcus aerophilus]